MERRMGVFSTHEIQEANFELLHCFLLLLLAKGLIKQEDVTSMCCFAKMRLEAGATALEGHMATAYVDLFLQTLEQAQAQAQAQNQTRVQTEAQPAATE